ncbi:hypothetical protein AG4045_014920 [Apium graveolens]|uniref:beta-glucosidase n=1 Tax=Apium graveolens TaxID=4045 RepID=A0A6L5BDD1_APIGR|nr:hypothetical protein AG4045_014920 [Apium graveolens]
MRSSKLIPAVGLLLLLLLCVSCMGESQEYMAYKDPSKPVNVRVMDLVGRMTVEEKIGQMAQIDRRNLTVEMMRSFSNFSLGSILSGGGSVPRMQASAEDWINMVNQYQKACLETRLGIPMFYGIDAVHGNNNVYKATIFPHNVGLGSTRDPDLVRRIGSATALEMRATGIPYAFAPCIAEHRELAREAVRKSLVLLKNGKAADTPLLPLPKKSNRILVAGSHANNLGYQCGGWTIEWQGVSGNNATDGTTILNAVMATIDPTTEVDYIEDPDPEYVKLNNYSYAIVAVGEPPSAESDGDNLNLTIPANGISAINKVCINVKCVVVLISGRPLVVEPYLSQMDALVAAWLPGSEGQGVADVLYGDYAFSAKSSRTWFRKVEQLPMNVGDSHYDPLFPYGYGLTT